MASSRSRMPQGAAILRELTKGAKKWEVEVMGQHITLYGVIVTHELADQIIEHCNLRNRTVRQNKVIEWARIMRSGEWQLGGEMIMTESGELIDGQHRVLAVAETELSMPFILRVIPHTTAKKVNEYLDVGVPRNISDFLHFNDVSDSSRISPVLVYERNARISGSPLQKVKGTKREYLALFREIGDETFKRVFDIMPRGIHTQLGVNRAFLDWFCLHAMKVDPSAAGLFFGLLMDPSQLKATDPPYVLREALIELQRKSEKISLTQQAHMTAKAWAYFGEGQPTSAGKIRHKINEDWPGVYGEEGEREAK